MDGARRIDPAHHLKLPRSQETRYIIKGAEPLHGEVRVAGAKNAIGKQLVASLLTSEPCVFSNVPRITEIDAILDMLSDIGTQFEWLDETTLRVETPEIQSTEVSQRYSGFNRIPILMLGPLLHRTGSVSVPVVGGCNIGPRPIDFHTSALAAMGTDLQKTPSGYRATATKLEGATIRLPYSSVGATENAIMTATLASGHTQIVNAAIEPEIVDTILFLQKMGALITIGPDRTIHVEGVDRLHGATHHSITDRIEVASFASAAIATDGKITVRGAQQQQMLSFLNALRRVGGEFQVVEDGITFYRAKRDLSAWHIETEVHPGFVTDWQQPFVVLLTQCEGLSVVHETVYENRFGYIQALQRMGAHIDLTDACLGSVPCRFRSNGHQHSCVVKGPTKLHGVPIEIPDLRAGFAYIIAALVASGTTEVTGIQYLSRGYADVPEKLAAIGASIQVVDAAAIPQRKAG
ncbi:MAG: UDP-N-acetylglucosamine 1-carboxyvinyltransferase [Planctomycetaceae bacterium]|nr:UDP-N-acetylglucosamine 1-carboxyvinyltransferase [Planctomycetaceae bacterium]